MKTKTIKMEALTDKIITNLKQQSDDSFNVEKKRILNNVIEMVKRTEKEAEFEEVARGLIKFMAERHHPHTRVILDASNAELLEGMESTGQVMDYIPD